ncbi:inositol 1,4,5-triphosphate receptor associated 2-like isoform X1 [Acipenser ruthenus]|uniref:inositol 1,4,5-triphosphate receptor associated 2-like isoform X1 n=2 Tax=Acipenser ruthenus TaxID=7906 RepID=UPI0027423CF5|nr:inositol 1,4,5-triphosphate receptor associated 2-like isoform X1 [Acipenser ruthenus]XP_058860795.1 inositol 1,4,5-triphosphate receptor associated 2-like isoform X1 [Acipenser ruthenus]
MSHPWSRLVHQRSLSLSSLFTASPPQGDSLQTPTQSCANETKQKVSRESHLPSKEKLKQQHRDLDALLAKVTAAGYKKNPSKMFNVTSEQAPELEAALGPCDNAERPGGSDDSDEDNCTEDLLASSWDNLSILERLGLNSVQMTEEEIESAFTHLSLAFKCDQYTLRKRLQAEERARDVTEENVHRELEEGRATLQTLKALCLDSKRNEIVQQLEQSLEILSNTIKRIASTAELLGAVHQEARVSRAVELMILHVENLKQHHVQELSELEEAKRLVQRNSRTLKFSEPHDESDIRQKLQHLRLSQQHISRRRVSIAVIPKQLQNVPSFQHFHSSESRGSDNGRASMDSDSMRAMVDNGRVSNRRMSGHLCKANKKFGCTQSPMEGSQDSCPPQPPLEPLPATGHPADSREWEGGGMCFNSSGQETLRKRKKSREIVETLRAEQEREDTEDDFSDCVIMETCARSRILRPALLSRLLPSRWLLLWMLLMMLSCVLLWGALSCRLWAPIFGP